MEASITGSIERLPGAAQSTVVTDELNRILLMLREACPAKAKVSFDGQAFTEAGRTAGRTKVTISTEIVQWFCLQRVGL